MSDDAAPASKRYKQTNAPPRAPPPPDEMNANTTVVASTRHAFARRSLIVGVLDVIVVVVVVVVQALRLCARRAAHTLRLMVLRARVARQTVGSSLAWDHTTTTNTPTAAPHSTAALCSCVFRFFVDSTSRCPSSIIHTRERASTVRQSSVVCAPRRKHMLPSFFT